MTSLTRKPSAPPRYHGVHAHAADALLSYSHRRRPQSQSIRVQLGLGAHRSPATLLLRSVSAPELPLHWLCVLPHPFLTTTRLQAPPAYLPPTPSFHFSPPSSLRWMEARGVSPLSTLLPIVSDHPSNPDAVLIRPFERIQQRGHYVASYSGGESSSIPP